MGIKGQKVVMVEILFFKPPGAGFFMISETGFLPVSNGLSSRQCFGNGKSFAVRCASVKVQLEAGGQRR